MYETVVSGSFVYGELNNKGEIWSASIVAESCASALNLIYIERQVEIKLDLLHMKLWFLVALFMVNSIIIRGHPGQPQLLLKAEI